MLVDPHAMVTLLIKIKISQAPLAYSVFEIANRRYVKQDVPGLCAITTGGVRALVFHVTAPIVCLIA